MLHIFLYACLIYSEMVLTLLIVFTNDVSMTWHQRSFPGILDQAVYDTEDVFLEFQIKQFMTLKNDERLKLKAEEQAKKKRTGEEQRKNADKETIRTFEDAFEKLKVRMHFRYLSFCGNTYLLFRF